MKKIKPTIETIKITTLDVRVMLARRKLKDKISEVSKTMSDMFGSKPKPKLSPPLEDYEEDL